MVIKLFKKRIMSKFNLLLNAATKVFSHYYCKHNINFIRNHRSLGGAFNQRQSARVITTFSQFSHQKARKEEQMALPQNISISSATSNPQDNDFRMHSSFWKSNKSNSWYENNFHSTKFPSQLPVSKPQETKET